MYNILMKKDLAKELIKYFKSLGIEVYTNTKARGHQGFFLKNRIDISKNTKEERIIPTLLHEFAHYIHNKLEPDMAKTGGALSVLFKLSQTNESVKNKEQKVKSENPTFYLLPFTFCPNILLQELLQVTNMVDENSLNHKLLAHKEQIRRKIKTLETVIREDFPNFMRSKKFKEFDKYIKKSKAKYLLKYDRIKFISPFFRHVEIFSMDNIEKDFPDMPRAFCAYIRLKSAQKKQARNSKRINYSNKYYSKPTELFARFVEGLYLFEERVQALAPQTTQRFFELLDEGYYFELKEVLYLVSQRVTINL